MSYKRGDVIKRTKYTDATMVLPEGKTCGDCRRYARCEMLFGCNKGNEVCDFAPSRFVDVKGGTS